MGGDGHDHRRVGRSLHQQRESGRPGSHRCGRRGRESRSASPRAFRSACRCWLDISVEDASGLMAWITSSSPPRITASSNAQRRASVDPASAIDGHDHQAADDLRLMPGMRMTAVGRIVRAANWLNTSTFTVTVASLFDNGADMACSLFLAPALDVVTPRCRLSRLADTTKGHQGRRLWSPAFITEGHRCGGLWSPAGPALPAGRCNTGDVCPGGRPSPTRSHSAGRQREIPVLTRGRRRR